MISKENGILMLIARGPNSGNWNFKLKRDLGAASLQEGVFFIDFNLFIKFMTGFDVCYYEDGYEHSSIKMVSDPDQATLLNVKITKPGSYYFSVHQINTRAFKDADSSFV